MPKKRYRRANKQQEEHYQLLVTDKQACLCLMEGLCLCINKESKDGTKNTMEKSNGTSPLDSGI